MLQLKGVKKYYGNIKAIDGVQLNIKDGEIFGVIGQEGSGKTTLLQLAAGLIRPEVGFVYLDGMDLSQNTYASRMQIGYVPQHFQLYEKLKVREYMEFYAGFYPLEGIRKDRWIQALLDQVHLLDMEDVYVENLSQGMSRRLCVAQALLPNPKVLVLDEPGNGMDPKSRVEYRKILKNLSQSNRTILISSHMISDLPDYCTSVGVLEKGRLLLEGSMDVILKTMKKEQPLFIQITGGEDKAIAVLKQNKQVKKITLADSGIVVDFEGEEESEAVLLRALIDAGVSVYSFNRTTGDFENSFLHIISGQGE